MCFGLLLAQAEDFQTIDSMANNPAGIFDVLVGGKMALMKQIKQYQDTIATAKKRGKDPFKFFNLNFLFVGSPGTGKTTVAMLMGKLFKSLGILASDEVLERNATHFTPVHSGQAAARTREIFETGLGKVLFIDEAYR